MWFKYMQFHQKMLKLQRTRDSQIFAEIYCETYSSVFLLAIAILRDAYRADKVVDQFYHLLLTTIQTMQNTAPLHLWIYAQVIRLAMEEDQQGEQIQQQAFHKGAVVQEKNGLSRGVSDPQQRTLLEAVESLEMTVRIMVILKAYHGFSVTDIIKITASTKEKIRDGLSTAKKHLPTTISSHMLKQAFYAAITQKGMGWDEMEIAIKNLLELGGWPDRITLERVATKLTKRYAIWRILGGVTFFLLLYWGGMLYMEEPEIVQVLLPHYWQQGNVSVHITVKPALFLKDLYLLNEKGEKTNFIWKDKGNYEVTLSQNGNYQIYAKTYSGKVSYRDFCFTFLDNESPYMVSYDFIQDRLEITVGDDGSGVVVSGSYGITTDGHKIFPFTYDNIRRVVTFQGISGGFDLHLVDRVGNTSKTNIQFEDFS